MPRKARADEWHPKCPQCGRSMEQRSGHRWACLRHEPPIRMTSDELKAVKG